MTGIGEGLSVAFLRYAGRTRYYVDATNGNDANNGLSPNHAWQTIAKVVGETFNPGDRILFKRGEVWSGTVLTISESGLPNNRIILGAYGSGNAPTIENTGVWPSATAAMVVNGDYILVDNFRFRDANRYGVGVYGEHVQINLCEATNVGIGIGLLGRYGTVSHCNIHDLHLVRDDDIGANYGAFGIEISKSYCDVFNNALVNCRAVNTDTVLGYDGGAMEIYARDDMTDINIHHNWTEGCSGFSEFGGVNGQDYEVHNVNAYLNISHNNRSMLYFHLQATNAIDIENIRFYANTIIEESLVNQDDSLIAFNDNPGATDFLFYNNLVYIRANNMSKIFQIPFNMMHENNLYDHDVAAFSDPVIAPDATEIVDTSGLVNIGADNFRPDTGSNAIDAGQDDGLTSDYEGNHKPQNEIADIGAYEHSA